MKRDLLTDIIDGRITVEDAERIYDQIMDSDDANRVQELLGLSPVEWTAFAQGVWFDELAKWRQDGWPSKCPLCSQRVVPEKYGWLVRQESDGRHMLTHISCQRDP